MSKEELKNNPEKLKELVRNDSNTDRSTKPVAIAPTSVAPKRKRKMRFAVAQPAAVASNNVNDLIKVTKQTIKVGDGKDDVVAAHDGEEIEYDSEFTIDNKVKAGDTMTINYDKNVIPSDLTDKMILSILLIHQERSLLKELLIKQLSKSHIHLQTM